MDEIITLLNGKSGEVPAPKPQKIESSPTQQMESPQVEQIEVGGENSWHEPLNICKLRTAGLASAKSATFGKVRNNGTKNHQGVDF